MIDFENVELTDRPSLFVMPQTESGYLLHRMRVALYRPSIDVWKERAQHGDVIGFSVLLDPEMYKRTGMATRHKNILDDHEKGTMKPYLTDAVYAVLECDSVQRFGVRLIDFHPDFFVPEIIEDEETDLQAELPESDSYRQASPRLQDLPQVEGGPCKRPHRAVRPGSGLAL
jgi:hypothetical protein